MEPPWDGGTKVCSNDPGHMTKMATMPIYGKNLLKIFSFGTNWPMLLKLGYYQVCSNDDPGLTFLWQGQIWSTVLLYGKKVKQWIFRNYCDIKVGRCRQLNEYMNLCECQRSRSFIALGPRSLRINISNFSLETARPIEVKFHLEPHECEFKWFMSHDQDGHHAHI